MIYQDGFWGTTLEPISKIKEIQGKTRLYQLMQSKINILFVCHGNICRSPMAEFVMKKLVNDAGLSDRIYIEYHFPVNWDFTIDFMVK